MTISGVTRGMSETKREVDATRPRQRVRPMASATPSGTEMATAIAASLKLWKRASLSAGSCQTELSRSSQYQRKDQPCDVDRDRPSLNEKRMAIRIGTIDQTR